MPSAPSWARAGLALALALLAGVPGRAADLDRSRKVVVMIYDVGLYDAELERALADAAARGVYAGDTAAARMRNRTATRALMLGERDPVLTAATVKVAARATDTEVNALLQAATSPAAVTVSPVIEDAVSVVKSSFQEALWDQLTRTARGSAEFPCTREQRSRCL